MSYKTFFSRVKQEFKELANEFGKRLLYPVQELIDEHLRESRETYAQHFVEAFLIGCKMIYGGCIALVHAALPFIASNTASSVCRQVIEQTNKRKLDVSVESLENVQNVESVETVLNRTISDTELNGLSHRTRRLVSEDTESHNS
mgnify:CR=1 FL=1